MYLCSLNGTFFYSVHVLCKKKKITFCFLAAEPVAVGMVIKNPLGIPLLMAKFTLVWQFTSPSSSSSSSSSPTSGGDSPSSSRGEKPAASCDVLEFIELKPNEERMVCHMILLKFNFKSYKNL